MSSQNNASNSLDTFNSLSEILNSLNSNPTNLYNSTNENENENNSEDNNKDNTININLESYQNNTNTNTNTNTNINTDQIKNEVQLFSNEIVRRVGNYLLNELEKKQSYVEELEEVIKFQQKEISELKSKLDSINKLELVARLKSSIDEKRNLTNYSLSSINEDEQYEQEEQEEQEELEEQEIPKQKVVQVVRVKKSQTNLTQSNTQIQQTQQIQQIQQTQQIQQIQQTQQTQSNAFIPSNCDLILGSGSRNKVKLISKAEEEELRYNGITILEKPQKQQMPKIVLDYDQGSEMSESQDKSTEIIKQRRRGARL